MLSVRIMDEHLISEMPVEDMDVSASTTTPRVWPRKDNRQFKGFADFGELKQVTWT
jgi:hypothetical protein